MALISCCADMLAKSEASHNRSNKKTMRSISNDDFAAGSFDNVSGGRQIRLRRPRPYFLSIENETTAPSSLSSQMTAHPTPTLAASGMTGSPDLTSRTKGIWFRTTPESRTCRTVVAPAVGMHAILARCILVSAGTATFSAAGPGSHRMQITASCDCGLSPLS